MKQRASILGASSWFDESMRRSAPDMECGQTRTDDGAALDGAERFDPTAAACSGAAAARPAGGRGVRRCCWPEREQFCIYIVAIASRMARK